MKYAKHTCNQGMLENDAWPQKNSKEERNAGTDRMNYEINTQSWGTEEEVGGKKSREEYE